MCNSRAVIATLLAIAPTLIPSAHAATIFVDAGQVLPPASQNGASWATAFKSLTSGLAAAIADDEVWVAGGTYKPTTGSDRGVAFGLKSGVRVYGGLHVGDTSLDQRDIAGNPSILSGEIGDPGLASDNSLHVVIAVGLAADTLLDGFTVRDGNANASPGAIFGGGVTVVGGSPIFRRCTFTKNDAFIDGAGASTFDSSARFVECMFLDNTAGNGGGLGVQGGSVTVVNCRFLGNTATPGDGGALRLLFGAGHIVAGCFFAGNEAGGPGGGGAILVSQGASTFTNCTIASNTLTSPNALGAGINVQSPATATISNCILWNNLHDGAPNSLVVGLPAGVAILAFNVIQGMASDANGNFSADPLFADLDGPDDQIGTLDDDARLRADSPCVDRGHADLLPADMADSDEDGDSVEPLPLDVDGDARLRDALVYDEGAGLVTHLDLGAAEHHRPGRVICVHPDGTGTNGLSWDDAVSEVSTGFELVFQPGVEYPIEVWVAGGTYTPTNGTDRSISFVHPSGGIAVFGGFAGGEHSLLQRDVAANPTILSGEIGGPGKEDNSYHVLEFLGDNYFASDVLDGFVITRGFAHGDPDGAVGGGVQLGFHALPTIRNCKIVGNEALVGGGVSSQVFAEASLVNCLISGNAAKAGGGVYTESSLDIRNCTIVSNISENGGAGIFAVSPSVTLVANTILYDNEDGLFDDDRAQLAFEEEMAFDIAFCVIECFGSSGLYGDASKTSGARPRFVGTAGPDGQHGTSDDSAAIQSHSPCIDAGKNGGMGDDHGDSDEDGVSSGELAPFDISLNPRFKDDAGVVDTGGPAPAVDIGAAEFQATSMGPAPASADIDGDGSVDGADLGLLLAAFGTSGGGAADLNGDCAIDGADLGELLAAWTG